MIRQESLFRSAAVSPDGQRLATGDDAGQITMFEPSDGTVVRKLPQQTKPVWVVGFSPDGRLLASGGLDGAVRLWDTETGEVGRTFVLAGQGVMALVISPDGQWLAASAWMEGVTLWRLATGERVRESDPSVTRGGGPFSAEALEFTPDIRQRWRACAGRLVAGRSYFRHRPQMVNRGASPFPLAADRPEDEVVGSAQRRTKLLD